MINKIKSYAFWVGLSSALVVLLQSLGDVFGFVINPGDVEKIILSFCSVLVVLGFVNKPVADKNEKVSNNIQECQNSRIDSLVDVKKENKNDNGENDTIIK